MVLCLREDEGIGSLRTKVIYQTNHDKPHINRVAWGQKKRAVNCCHICYVGSALTDKALGIYTLGNVQCSKAAGHFNIMT